MVLNTALYSYDEQESWSESSRLRSLTLGGPILPVPENKKIRPWGDLSREQNRASTY
jgi:hypothetical protein